MCNSIANTSEGVLFLPSSDVYVRSFLYLFYTLIKLYYTKALSDQASSLATNGILLLQRPRILVSSVVQQQPFKRSGSPSTLVSGIVQGHDVRELWEPGLLG